MLFHQPPKCEEEVGKKRLNPPIVATHYLKPLLERGMVISSGSSFRKVICQDQPTIIGVLSF